MTSTDSNGRTREVPVTTTERVCTYSEDRRLYFPNTVDSSGEFNAPTGRKYLKLYLHKNITLGNTETQIAIENAKAQIIQDNKHRDVHISMSHQIFIPGFSDSVLTDVDKSASSYCV